MSRLNYILSRHRTQSRTFGYMINSRYACLPLIWFGKTSEILWIQTICKLCKQVVERERASEREREIEKERERERDKETSACIRISCHLEKYHKSYLEMLLVCIGFCTTKSDI